LISTVPNDSVAAGGGKGKEATQLSETEFIVEVRIGISVTGRLSVTIQINPLEWA
jgi:hypothetical protein